MESNSKLEPLDKYLLLGNNLYQIFKTKKNQEIFVHNGAIVWYEPDRDGQALTLEDLERTHPEWLI